MYVAVNVGSVLYGVCALEIGVCGCKCRQCALWGVCWKLVYVAVNLVSLHYRVCTRNWCMWL